MTFRRERLSDGWMGVCMAVIAAMIIIGFNRSSEAADPTGAGIVSGRATDATSILITMPYTGDDNGSNTYTIDYKTCASGTWTNWVTNAPHSPSPYTTAITGLTNNQCYSIRATYTDSDGISGRNPQTIQISAGWDNTLLHNSNRFPGTTKWSGDWGTPTGQYNRIVCETCHTRTTANIKRVKDAVITAPDSPAQRFPGETGGVAPVFRSATAPNGFGDDAGGHASSQKICEVCHSTTSYHRYNTVGQTGLDHNNATDCIACHPHSLGFKDAAECNSCHGAPPGSGIDTNTPAVFAASHAKHYDAVSGGVPVNYAAASNRSTATGYVFDCGICHSSNNADHLANQDGTVDVKLTTGGTYAPGSYVGGDNLPPPGTATFKNSNGSCSNVYCHGNYPGSGENATPTWGTASSGACGTCHGASNTEPPASGNHGRHAGIGTTVSTGNREYRCTLCHTGIIGGNAPDNYSITDTSKHANNTVDWSFDTSDNRLSASPIYSITSGTQPPSDGTTPRAYGTCTNVYCHSNVQPDGGVGAPTYDAPQWGDTTGGWGDTCSACHNSGGHLEIYTGGHQAHIQDYYFGYSAASTARKCTLCHKYNASADYSACNAHCHSSREEVLRHADGKVDVSFDTVKAGSSASYDGTTAPGDGYGKCSNSYCHSNGTSVSTNAVPANTSPNWGAGIQLCDSCHGYGPSYPNGAPKANSHQAHSAKYTCNICHFLTTNNGTSISSGAMHVNRAYDVSGVPGGFASFSYSYASSGGTCSTNYCHSNVQPEGGIGSPSLYALPKWGDSANVYCGTCHKGVIGHTTDSEIESGGHARHLQSSISSVSYGAAKCSTCHYITSGTGCSNCHQAPEHVNGQVDIIFEPSAQNAHAQYQGTPQPGDGYSHCATVYCHSDGKSNISSTLFPVTNTTPTWGSSVDPQGDAEKCNNCHGNPPTGDLHPLHVSRGFACNICHAAPDSSPLDVNRHVKGSVNVDAGGTFDYQSNTYPVTFTYTYRDPYTSGTFPEGSTCSSISCHQRMNINVDPNWSANWSYETIEGSSSYTETCSADGLQNAINLALSPVGGTAPYTCYIDWGDGSPAAWGGCSQSHNYARGFYTITWLMLDANGAVISSPGTRFFRVTPCNQPPVPQFDLVSAGDACYGVILKDRSYDPDADKPDTSGTGRIKISWGGYGFSSNTVKGFTQGVSKMTTSDPGASPPSERQHGFVYTAGGNATVYIAVRDKHGFDWVCSEKKTYTISNGNITLNSTSGVNQTECDQLKSATPNYASPVELDYQFKTAAEYWSAANQLTALSVVTGGYDKVISTTSTGTDPYMRNSCLGNMQGSTLPKVFIRMKTASGCGTNGRLCWTTEADTVETDAKSHFFTLTSNGNFQVYELDLSTYPSWINGDIRSLRLDPTTANGCAIEVDYIRSPNIVNYQFSSYVENWAVFNEMTSVRIVDDNGLRVLSGKTTGSNPYMRNTSVDFYGSDVQKLYIRMKTSCGSTGVLFWTTAANSVEDYPNAMAFTLNSDNQYHVYEIDLSYSWLEWTGQNIKTLRLDPVDESGCDLKIDYIQGPSPTP